MLTGSKADVDAMAGEITSAEISGSVHGIRHRRAADIQPKPISWLWPGRLARGKLNVIAGHPGLGKSQLTIAMAASVTLGRNWPDSTPCRPGRVVFVSAEDDADDTIAPRLAAAGADLERVTIVDDVLAGYAGDGSECRRAISLQEDVSRIARLLEEIERVDLLVIDPVSAFMGGVDSYKNAEIRSLLSPLSDMAARLGTCVVLVNHLSKGGTNDALMRVSGSIGVVAAARSAWLVGRDPEDEDRRLLLCLKNNIGIDNSGLAFRIESARVGAIETSRVVWLSGVVSTKASELMATSNDEDRNALHEAKDFLLELLEDQPVPANRVQSLAREAGISPRTLARAKSVLGVVSRKSSMKTGWEWAIPSKDAKNTEGCHSKDKASFGNVGNLRGVLVEFGTHTPESIS